MTNVNKNKLLLAQLKISIIKLRPELRLDFFRHSKATDYQAKISRMHVEEFKNFIEIFPPNDAIKFLNLSFISAQIMNFRRPHDQLSKDSYIDLLNYFEPNQKDAVKKLLRPISANIDTRLLRQGIFKEKIMQKTEQPHKFTDMVDSHYHYMDRTR